MDKDSLIQEINEQSEKLTKKNKKYYDDILIYVRLSFEKSEQEMEEILKEILDHIIMAQEEGRGAEEVFGSNPKEYLQELMGELPKLVMKDMGKFIMMGILYFLASATIFYSLIQVGLYYIFSLGSLGVSFHIGTAIVNIVVSILIAYFCIYFLGTMLRGLCFKNIHKILEFFLFWLYSMLTFGLFFVLIFFMPSFGPEISLSWYMLLAIGVVLYVAARFTRKKIV